MNYTRNEEEIKYQYANEFLWELIPFGSADIRHMTDKAYELNIPPYELANILFDYQETGVNLFDDSECTTDLNAIFNYYILSMARDDIEQVMGLDLDDYNIYFFANYLDDPLQYSTLLVDDINEKIKELGLTRKDFDNFSNYIFDILNIDIED